MTRKRSAEHSPSQRASHASLRGRGASEKRIGALRCNAMRSTLATMPGAAHGPAKLGHSPPALPKLVSRAGPAWRSTTVTAWPSRHR
ncbi:Uncharacterised protein [Bordetella pertussis]|nr:Uncharacterised protein [Bordetella pertussis]